MKRRISKTSPKHEPKIVRATEVKVNGKTELNDPAIFIARNNASIDPSSKKIRVDWNAVTALSSSVALICLVIGLFYNAAELRASRQIAQAQYVMDYYGLLQQYNDILAKLENGDWSNPEFGPQTPEEWSRVARYMGLLEQLEVFIESDVMTIDVVDRNYSHRINTIYRNNVIRGKTVEQASFRWQLFLKLIKRLEAMPVYQGLRERDKNN